MKPQSIRFAFLATFAAATVGILPNSTRADIFLTQFSNGTISQYANSGETINASLVSGLSAPEGLVQFGEHLFVANTGQSAPNGPIKSWVGEYTISGATVNDRLIPELSAQVSFATFMAVSDENLFVNNRMRGIGEYTTSGATVNSVLIPVPQTNNPINQFDGIAVSQGYIYVSDDGNHTIRQYTTSGTLVNDSLISGLNFPAGIAISGDKLFVANLFGGTIGEYTTSGATVNASLISGLNGPTNIALLGDELYVTLSDFVSGLGGVGKYTTSGATLNADLITGLETPFGIVVTAPEPSGLALGLVGLFALAAIARLRTKRQGRQTPLSPSLIHMRH